MGLDMYAMTTKETIQNEVDLGIDDDNAEVLHYWRKHPNLHGWMESLYYQKGGIEPEFNCVNLALTEADIDELELAIKEKQLPDTCGFFFGSTDGSEVEYDLEFITKARQAIASGLTVFYHSWW